MPCLTTATPVPTPPAAPTPRTSGGRDESRQECPPRGAASAAAHTVVTALAAAASAAVAWYLFALAGGQQQRARAAARHDEDGQQLGCSPPWPEGWSGLHGGARNRGRGRVHTDHHPALRTSFFLRRWTLVPGRRVGGRRRTRAVLAAPGHGLPECGFAPARGAIPGPPRPPRPQAAFGRPLRRGREETVDLAAQPPTKRRRWASGAISGVNEPGPWQAEAEAAADGQPHPRPTPRRVRRRPFPEALARKCIERFNNARRRVFPPAAEDRTHGSERGSGPHAGCVHGGGDGHDDRRIGLGGLRVELEGMRQSALRSRAELAGIAQDAMDAADDASNTKAAFVELLLEHAAAADGHDDGDTAFSRGHMYACDSDVDGGDEPGGHAGSDGHPDGSQHSVEALNGLLAEEQDTDDQEERRHAEELECLFCDVAAVGVAGEPRAWDDGDFDDCAFRAAYGAAEAAGRQFYLRRADGIAPREAVIQLLVRHRTEVLRAHAESDGRLSEDQLAQAFRDEVLDMRPHGRRGGVYIIAATAAVLRLNVRVTASDTEGNTQIWDYPHGGPEDDGMQVHFDRPIAHWSFAGRVSRAQTGPGAEAASSATRFWRRLVSTWEGMHGGSHVTAHELPRRAGSQRGCARHRCRSSTRIALAMWMLLAPTCGHTGLAAVRGLGSGIGFNGVEC